MDIDLVTLVLIIVIIGYLIYSRVKMYNDHIKSLEVVKERKAMKKIFTGQMNIIAYIFFMVISVIGLVVIYINKANIEDFNSWFLLFVILFATAGVDIIRVKVMYTTYYNDHGMFVNQDYIRYNSIKDYTQKGFKFTTEIHTFNKETYIVSTKSLKILEDKIAAKQK